MPPPFVLSPYLRPLRRPEGEGFLVDDGVTGWIDLGVVEQDVVRALWDPRAADRVFPAIAQKHGPESIRSAIEQLRRSHVLFDTQAECEAHLDDVLEAGKPARVPFVDQIELTNICPFRCQFCPRGVAGKMKREMGRMDFALFEKLLAQLHPDQGKWRDMELHHLGESLVHPQVVDFVAAAAAHGLKTELSCNPSMLKDDLGPRLVDAGLRRMVISIDGIDNETSIGIRGPAARYDKGERNLERLLAHAATLEKPPTIVIQMIDLSKNKHQHEAFVARWGSTGHPFVQAYVKNLDGPDPDTGKGGDVPVSYLCGYPWRSVVVLWDGRVVPCCRDSDAALVLGDLNTQTLEEIWNGPEVKKLRRELQTRSVPCGHLCDGCPWQRDAYAQLMPKRHPDRMKAEPLYW